MLECHVKLCVTEQDFSEKNFLPKNWENGPKMGQKQVLQFIRKFGHYILLNLIYNENLYYLLFSCTNPIFGKIFGPEI